MGKWYQYPRICTIDECGKPMKALGFCHKHYKRYQRHGDPLHKRQRGPCSIEECDRPHQAKGFCNMHYQRFRKHGDPHHQSTKYDHPETCAKDNCDNPYYAKGLCNNHYQVEKRARNTQYKLAHYLRARIPVAMKNGQKAGSAVLDLGCSITMFMLYIENQFEPGMSWDNHGDWHLDHVIPLAAFDLTEREDFLEAAHYLNIQPMWADENFSKGDRTLKFPEIQRAEVEK